MPVQPCPNCHTPTARLLESTSRIAWVNYYRCESWGHVWTTVKNQPDGPIWNVTVAPKDPQEPDPRE